MIAAPVATGGCAAGAYGPRADDYYYYSHNGVHYPAEDGLPYDADVNHYTRADRHVYYRPSDPFRQQPAPPQDADRR